MASQQFLQQAYLAYFGRPGDVLGMAYYKNATEAEVKAAFSASPESQAFFGKMSIGDQINTIYKNLFNRDAEPAGLVYWADEIGSGRLSLADAAMGILAGAQNDDKVAVTNKLAASAAFTAALDTSVEVRGYAGNAAIEPARAFLAAVDATAASLTAATAGVDAAVLSVTDAGRMVAGQTFMLTAGVDAIVGTSNNDVINGTLEAASNADGTFKSIDAINGGAGTDTLAVVDATGGLALPSLVNVTNVEILSLRSAGALTATTASTVAFETVTATQSAAATITANAASNVNVSGATGAITVNGGKDIVVNDATADEAVSVGVTTASKGSVSVTDTKVGTGLITVEGGTNVTVVASGVTIAAADNFDADSSAGLDTKAAVVVGHVTAASGTANVSSAGAAITAATATSTLGAIEVNAKGNVTVTQAATSDAAAAAADTASVATITQGAVKVVTGADATTVSVVQSAAATANDAVKAVAGVKETQVLTFAAHTAANATTIIGGLTFTAAKALTAAEVAAAFANLTKGATAGSAPASNGSYSGTFTSDWTSGDVSTASVTFTAVAASGSSVIGSLGSASGTVAPTIGTNTAGVTEVLAETGKLGVVAGAVTVIGAITGADVLSTVNLNSYGTSTVESDALTTLNLSNSAGGLTVTTASKGSITANLDKVTGTISVDGGTATITELTINASGTKSASAVTADVAKTVTINAAVDLDLTNSSFDAATKMVVTGAGKVTLDGDHTTSVLAAVDASAATGTVDASRVALTAAGIYTGGSGADTFTVTASATKASTGGAGNDVITVSSFGTGGSVDAGEGVDTLNMAAADAATASASAGAGVIFMSKATNFEKLSIGAVADTTSAGVDTVTVDLSALTYSDIISAGATDGDEDILALTNAASGVNLTITAEGLFNVGVKDAATGLADVVNIFSESDGNLTLGTVTTANVETVNITANDKLVDTSGAFNEFGVAAADGKDDTNSVQSLNLTADKATTVNVSGSADLTVDLVSSSAVTVVNASAMTGKFTLIADGKSTGTTVTGGTGNDTLTGSGNADVLIGGAGDDRIVADTLTTMTGGEGKDTFVMKGAVAATAFSTITDLSAGDTIDLNNAVATFSTTKLSLVSTATFADYLAAAVGEKTAGATTENAEWFQFNGNTYIVIDGFVSTADTAGYTATEDSVIEITGLVDLSKAVFSSTAETLTIV